VTRIARQRIRSVCGVRQLGGVEREYAVLLAGLQREHRIACRADAKTLALVRLAASRTNLKQRNRDKRSPAPGPVFARVESLAAQGVRYVKGTPDRDERLRLAIDPPPRSQGMGDAGNVGSAGIKVSAPATARSAASRWTGNFLPRRAARRRIPAQARALKKYRGWTSPVTKTRDNEHALPALGQSEILSVQNSVGEPIPEFDQAPEDGTKVPSGSRRQDSRDVLPRQPLGPCSLSKAKKLEGQVATAICQPSSESGDAETLAGRTADKKVNWFAGWVIANSDRGEIAKVRNTRPSMSQDS